jgi:ligand-binding sensor domain-containing protein
MKKACFVLLGLVLILSAGCGGTPKSSAPKGPELKVEFYSASQGLPDSSITALAFFGGQMWVGTKNGLARFDGVNWQVHMKKNTNVLGSDMIEGFYVTDHGIFIATENGVAKFDGNRWNTILTGSRARSVAARGSVIAVATAHGIEHTSGTQFTPFNKENGGLVFDEVNAVEFDRSGKLWVGTRAGMGFFNGSMFQNFTGPAKMVMGTSLVDVPPSPASCQLIGNNINCIIPFGDRLAVGTTSGLSITDMNSTYTSYFGVHRDYFQRGGSIVEEEVSANSPLPGNSIRALAALPNQPVLFVGTEKGLIALHDTKWVELQGKISQLRAGPITALAAQGDVLLVGTAGGFFRVEGISGLFPATGSN